MKIATRRQSLTVLLPAVTTAVLLPEQFMSINAQAQIGYSRHISRQSTAIQMIFLVRQFPSPETPWLLVQYRKIVTKRPSLMVLLPVAIIIAQIQEQFIFISEQVQTGHRKHTSRRLTMMQMTILAGQ